MRVVGYTATTLFTRSLGALHGVLALVVIASIDQCPLQSTRPHRVDCMWLLDEPTLQRRDNLPFDTVHVCPELCCVQLFTLTSTLRKLLLETEE